MDFQRGLTEKAKLERKGPAVLAAGVFDMYIYIYVYIYIYICARTRRDNDSYICAHLPTYLHSYIKLN